jgi:hypothetical protein
MSSGIETEKTKGGGVSFGLRSTNRVTSGSRNRCPSRRLLMCVWVYLIREAQGSVAFLSLVS